MEGGSGGSVGGGAGGGPGSGGAGVGSSAGGYLGYGFFGSGGSDVGSGGGAVFDDSDAAGPCGQWVKPVADFCLYNDCQPEWLPNCASIEQLDPTFPAELQEGCGYTKFVRSRNEGDQETSIWTTDDHKLVLWATRGATAIGCAVKGTRYGEVPACDDWVSMCNAGGAAGQ